MDKYKTLHLTIQTCEERKMKGTGQMKITGQFSCLLMTFIVFNRPKFQHVHLLLMHRICTNTKNTWYIYTARKHYTKAHKFQSLAVPGEKLIT